MSIAGIRSNRGDGYQTLVALDWALTVLSDADFQWIEVDSISYAVDDVVVGKADGMLICCQCKKNQTNFKQWTVADLADELEKAASLLASNNMAKVRFYSRSPFSALAKLREYALTQPDVASYSSHLSQENQKTDAALSRVIAAKTSNLSSCEFLCRTIFETSNELDRMESFLYERLERMVNNPKAAYVALWTRIDQLGARMSDSSNSSAIQHRLTKEDLNAIINQAGAVLAPKMQLVDVRASFATTSAIGRSWKCEIAGQHITRPVTNELLAAIDGKKRSILLTGLPGSGKTCEILAIQGALEQRMQAKPNVVPLFIQAREFADLITAQERQAQGLSEQWVEQAARMAEEAEVVVVIDSLDVLSIAREHNILTYFLAQIDRLLWIPNVTVLTSCRDFDQHYDRRIAERTWDCVLSCPPLDWESEVSPLLEKLGIRTTTIDAATRELIQNPRELALFVELAQRNGSFNVVTSQSLAQRYLDIIVGANSALGETAMQAIEGAADEMLKTRSLVISQQRLGAPQRIRRALCSLNVLQETHDGKFTFGHQTLLDVLVISGALRRGVTLNEFIQGLPPVPFVRPSIRSFVAQLVTETRSEFRRQLRTVLTGSAAFHIRRLVAEALAEQIPEDDDWPLIRDLHKHHREVFQVIHRHAVLVDWHHFWLRHLVPVLIDMRDASGLATHVHEVSKWKNVDTAGVVQFWVRILSLDWLDEKDIAYRLGHYLSEIDTDNLAFVEPLVMRLISMPRRDHDFLGQTIARCVTAGVIDDALLWRYVAGDINNDDILKYHFGNKLRCQPHEFGGGNKNFLRKRMEQSPQLLDFAVESIEQWSLARSARFGGAVTSYRDEFLDETSYRETHMQHDIRHVDSENILLDAMEAAILGHAQAHSTWWIENSERLCFNHEGALRYFAIIACSYSPQANIELVARVLSDKESLESNLSYELGALIGAAFIYLDQSSQDTVMACIVTTWDENIKGEQHHARILRKRAELIAAIPSCLRSPDVQEVLETYEKERGSLRRQPRITSRSGSVSAPFSFDVFIRSTDSDILRLLAHYAGYTGEFDDFLVGGEREVGWQLREAALRHPSRFLLFLTNHWTDISGSFRDDIMDGITNYLNYRYGNLQSNTAWEPIEEPVASDLAVTVLDELERHSEHWHHNNSASNALRACAHVIEDTQNAARLVFMAISFASLRETSLVEGNSGDLLTTGINMMGGHIVEGLMIITNKLQENGVQFPELLAPTLLRFAGHEHPAIRVVVVRYLPYLQSKNPVLGWRLFERAMQDSNGLWQVAEKCLYYAYHNHFDKVEPFLVRIRSEGTTEDMEIWGRISALAALSNRIDFVAWLEELKALDITEAWRGAGTVWTHPGNIQQHRNKCLAGIEAGLANNKPHATIIAGQIERLFRHDTPVISIPIGLIRLLFTVLMDGIDEQQHHFSIFGEWLNNVAHQDSNLALAATESYLEFVKHSKLHFYDHKNSLTQLMTRLFAEAEEREESDDGEMLRRVVSIQDTLLSLGLDSISAWLAAAERP